MEAKKISFGFSKITKKPTLIPANTIEKEKPGVELIKCLEGQEIKVYNEKQEDAPLVIPLKDSQKTSTALASLKKRRAVLLGEEDEIEVNVEKQKSAENTTATNGADVEDLEKRAARELLAELQDKQEITETNFVLPAVKPDDLPLDGAKEATLDDYEQVPVEQFGKAMLRGMGWVDPPPPKKGEKPLDDAPYVRPKGMGLGADKALKLKPLLVPPEANEVLEIKKQAYVRILGGKHKDLYGQIEGFNEHAGRVIVKMAIGGAKEEFNEFLCQPVAKKEFTQYGKYLNSAKYEEYKKADNLTGQQVKQENTVEQKYEVKRESSNQDYDRRRDRKDAEKKYRPKEETYERSKDREREAVKSYSTSSRDKKRKSRSHERSSRDYVNRKVSASTSHRRRHSKASDEATTPDTSNSSDSESDADSAYERKQNKKSVKKSKSHKNTKRLKSKTRHQRRNSSPDTDASKSSSSEEERKKSKKHKKKTKKSKRPRSRSRSRDRHRSSRR